MREGWTYKRLGDVCTIERGGSPRPIEAFITDSPDGLNWIKIGDATDGSKFITATKEKIKPEGLKKTRLVHKGDFILSNSMSFGRPYILAIDGCIHDGWLVLRDNENTFDKSYLYYVLSSPTMFREFKKLAVGGVVNNLNTKLVQSVVVAIPPRLEQERIVAELDLLQGIIDKQKAQLKELDTLTQSIFYDMFGDPVENEKGWMTKKLKEACAVITDGTHNSPISTECGDFKYITAKNIKKDGFDFKGLTYVPASVHKEIYARCAPQYGDVLFIKDGATTGVAMINTLHEEFSLLSSVALIRPGALLCNRYLRDFLNHPSTYRSVRNNMGGAAITRLTLSKIGDFLIPLPPLHLQQAFATKIEAIERQKASINASIAETQKLFDYTMDKYFG